MKEKLLNSKFFSLLKKIFKEQEAKIQLPIWLSVLVQFVFSFLLEFVIEAFSRHSLMEALKFSRNSTQVFCYNALLIFMTSLIVFLFRKRNLFRLFVFGTWFVLGLSNGIILENRVTPLTGPDFKNIEEALGVVRKYFTTVEIIAFILLAIILILIIIVYIFRCPKYKGKMLLIRVVSIVSIVVYAFGFAKLTSYLLDRNILTSYFGNIAFAYEDYGFPYCFSVTVFDTGISEPNNYSELKVKTIANNARIKAGQTEINEETKPNIVVVQLESFFDVSRVNYMETSEDPIPNWHSLTENYTSGYYTVPTIGAGTANTEFETLTGMSLRFFGAGEYPFKAILKEKSCESSAYILKDLGYTTFGLHDNEANFYSRRIVYSNLGFDYFISEEYMQNQDDVNENGWMRDENLIEPIMECLDSTETKDYVFTVSVQPHGSYPTEAVYDDPEITVSGNMSEAQKNAWTYYVNQIHEEDQFIADLIAALEERDEPTILLLYGDHLPTMNLKQSDLQGGSLYDTCYVMWDNMGLEKEDKDIYSYQAMAYLFDRIGIHDGNVFAFQQSNLDHREIDFMSKLQMLQYDLLYGENYLSKENNYLPDSHFSLGLYRPEIKEAEQISNNLYRIVGEHFTQSCKVMVDGEIVNTVFVDENQLLAIDTEINKHSVISIGVQSNSSTHKILSESKSFYMSKEDDPDQNMKYDPDYFMEDEIVHYGEEESIEEN